jgi:xanthine phosphoribosyltransferase
MAPETSPEPGPKLFPAAPVQSDAAGGVEGPVQSGVEGADPQPELFYIPYERFLADVEALALQLEPDDWRPDFLVGIGRGGLVPAAYLSHRLDVAMLSVDHSSGEPGFAGELLDKLAAKIRDGRYILIVDDINDSGSTITFLRDAIEAKSGDGAKLRVAVLVNNIRSKAKAEYWGTQLDRDVDKRWFVFPWEALASPETLIGAAAEVPERLA